MTRAASSPRAIPGRRPLAALALLSAALGGCASAPRAALEPVPPPPEPVAPATPDPRVVSTERFYRGKELALSGDASCARLEFEAALAAFDAAARPGDADDLAFAGELWESVQLYRALTDRAAEPEERPPAEDPTDTLLAASPAASPQEVQAARREVASAGGPSGFDIPVVVNDAVLKAVAFYQFRTPQAFAGALKRSGRYLDLMRGILKEKGLPQDLVYVAMIESAFKHNAHSRKAAHGFWQFIDGTARRYGLKRGKGIDERSDFVKSTRAAAAYFRDLYEMFGDWHLAMAGYDTGEGRILRGLQRTGARDYWELASGNFLHRETREYVPYVLAAALIAKDPARFGFDVVLDPPVAYEVVELRKPVDLARVARAIDVPLDELAALNGELKTRSTPRVPSYPLRVPQGMAAALAASLPALPEAPEIRERRVTVRKGDTLAKVAARYKVSAGDVALWNDLPPNARLRRGMGLTLPTLGAPSRPAAPRVETAAVSEAPARTRTQGEIRALPGPDAAVSDPASIAPPGTPVVRKSEPPPNRYEIPAEGFESAPARAAPKRVVHVVRSGETLFRIATQYGTTVTAIRRENRLGPREALRVGRRLTLTLPG